MPELPEVETIRRELEHEVKGKKVKSVEIIDYKNATPGLEKKLSGSKIKGARRRAKLLMIDFSNDKTLLVHLKMTGYFLYQEKGEDLTSKKTHAIFRFGDGTALVFNDARKFGYLKLKDTKKYDVEKDKKYGPEPLSEEFTLGKFRKMLADKERSMVKTALMDQQFIAGVGNIYSDEAAHRARIMPDRKIKTLSKEEIERLYEELRKVLKESLKAKAAFVDQPKDVYGKEGKYRYKLRVYGREKDEKGHKVITKKIGGRTSHFCKKCQE